MENKSTLKSENISDAFIHTLGWQTLPDGSKVYCAGNIIIGKNGIIDYPILDTISQKYLFEYNPDMAIEECIEKTLNVISLNMESSSILFSSGLLGVMRSLFLDADIKIPCSVYLYGTSQKARKTTTAKICTLLYCRSMLQTNGLVCIMQMNSSRNALEDSLDECKDTVLICDDLYRSDKRTERQNNGTARAVIREFADNSPRQVKGGNIKKINAQIVITAEYIIPYKSDVGRCFLVEVSEGTDDTEINKCMNSPLALSTTYYYFIQYLCENYDEIVDTMRQAYQDYHSNMPMVITDYARIHEMKFILELAMSIFLKWCSIKSCSNKRISYCANLLDNNTKKCVEAQEKILRYLCCNENDYFNYAKIVRDLWETGYLLTEKTLKNKTIVLKKNGFLVTLSYLVDIISRATGKSVSAKRLAKYFSDCGISVGDGSKNVVKHGKEGKRYLYIKFVELNERADSMLYRMKESFSHTEFKK